MTSRCERWVAEIMKQLQRLFWIAAALTLPGSSGAAFAQNVENGKLLSERWCAGCHAIGPSAGKSMAGPSYAAIAAKDTVTADMIASFLRLPHATMPNQPISRNDAQDIAAFILASRK
jgi:mono/diheme cytochrome c family protein